MCCRHEIPHSTREQYTSTGQHICLNLLPKHTHTLDGCVFASKNICAKVKRFRDSFLCLFLPPNPRSWHMMLDAPSNQLTAGRALRMVYRMNPLNSQHGVKMLFFVSRFSFSGRMLSSCCLGPGRAATVCNRPKTNPLPCWWWLMDKRKPCEATAAGVVFESLSANVLLIAFF